MLRALCVMTTLVVLPLHAATADTPCNLGANAALKYWQGFAQLPGISEAAQKTFAADCVTRPLDDGARELVSKADYALLMLHRGAALRDCDWSVGSEEGIRALLPHGKAARVLVPLACLRARIRFAEGRNAEALDDIIAAMTLSRHIAQDGLLIAVLLGYSLEQRVMETLAVALPKLDTATVKTLTIRIAALPAGGSAPAALKFEERFTLDWFAREVKQANDQAELLSFLSKFCGTDQKGREFLDRCGGNLDGVLQSIEKTRPAYRGMAALLDLPVEQFDDALAREVERQANNPVFVQLFPGMDKVDWAYARAKVRRALLQAALAVGLGGPKALKDHPDPVVGGSFEYTPFEGGFELRSKLSSPHTLPARFQLDDEFNKPVVLTVGRRAR